MAVFSFIFLIFSKFYLRLCHGYPGGSGMNPFILMGKMHAHSNHTVTRHTDIESANGGGERWCRF